jgi:hypothetical protein
MSPFPRNTGATTLRFVEPWTHRTPSGVREWRSVVHYPADLMLERVTGHNY